VSRADGAPGQRQVRQAEFLTLGVPQMLMEVPAEVRQFLGPGLFVGPQVIASGFGQLHQAGRGDTFLPAGHMPFEALEFGANQRPLAGFVDVPGMHDAGKPVHPRH